MKEAELPIIEVSLVLSSRTIETTKITELVRMSPTEERDMNDWPNVIKNNTKLPEELKPRNEWSWTTRFEKCLSVNEALGELIHHFQNSIANIVNMSEEFSIQKSVIVLIHSDATSMPEVGLESNTIEFLNSIKAPIYFDIYTY